MKRIVITGIILVLLLACVGAVSAFAPINFSYNGDLALKYLGKGGALYDNQFGIDLPLPHTPLGHINGINPATPGSIYENIGKCYKDKKVEVVLFIKTPVSDGSHTYYSNAKGYDGKDHAQVIKQSDGSFYVGFEDWTDTDFKDVQFNIACIPEEQPPIPTPEFPTMALPVALLVGLIGVVLFMQRTKEK